MGSNSSEVISNVPQAGTAAHTAAQLKAAELKKVPFKKVLKK